MPNPASPSSRRQAVSDRAHGCCEYCLSQEAYSPDPFSVEHIIPRSADGTEEMDNLAFSCQACNNHKYTRVTARDPMTGASALLYNPRRHLWREHFAWSLDKSFVIGLTPTGRATIERLRINRVNVVNLRRILYVFGKHPPEHTAG